MSPSQPTTTMHFDQSSTDPPPESDPNLPPSLLEASTTRPLDQLTSQLQLLLTEERNRSQQIKSLYSSLKSEHLKLQKDFLALQSEMKGVLEETTAFRSRRDLEKESLQQVLQEKDRFIQELRQEVAERDPVILRDKFKEELKEPIKRLEQERDLLERENEKLRYEIKMQSSKIEQLEKEVVDSTERVRLSFGAEVNLVKKEKEELKVRLMELSQTPDNIKMLRLTDENQKLERKLNSVKFSMEDTEVAYKRIQSQIQVHMSEHEEREAEMKRRITSLKTQLETAKDGSRDYNRLKEEYDAVKKEHSMLQEEMPRIKAELMEEKILSREFQRQKDRYREEYHRIKQLVDEERKELTDFKTMAEKNVSRLRRSIEDERRENQHKFASLDREISGLRKERDRLKIKHHQSLEVLSILKQRLTAIEKTRSAFFRKSLPDLQEKGVKKNHHRERDTLFTSHPVEDKRRQRSQPPTSTAMKATCTTTTKTSKDANDRSSQPRQQNEEEKAEEEQVDPSPDSSPDSHPRHLHLKSHQK